MPTKVYTILTNQKLIKIVHLQIDEFSWFPPGSKLEGSAWLNQRNSEKMSLLNRNSLNSEQVNSRFGLHSQMF